MASEERKLPTKRGRDATMEIVGYGELLEDLKTRIRVAQIRATLAVNREILSL